MGQQSGPGRALNREGKKESGVVELRKPLASATMADGSVWEVYGSAEASLEKDESLWAVRRGAHPQRLQFADFTLTSEGKEALMMWALRECLREKQR